MSTSLDCRDIECWRELFSNTVSADQRERCERHLESYPVCQARRLPPLPPKIHHRRLNSFMLAAVVALLGLGVVGLLQMRVALMAQQSPPPQFHQDFRGGKRPEAPLTLFGPDAKKVTSTEVGGFRITLPAGRPSADHVGLMMRPPVEGDFEITTGYEIIHIDPPKTVHGAGFELYIMTATTSKDALACSRVLQKKDGDLFTGRHMAANENGIRGQKSYQSARATSATGQMRLRRKGTVAILSAAEDGGEFREVGRFELGGADLNMVRLAAISSNPPVGVDLRIKDLTIRSNVPIVDVKADLTDSSGTPTSEGPNWLIAAGVVVAVIAATTLGAVLVFMRQRRRAADQSANPPTPPAISMPCSGCGKSLKVKPELAGKKVKCPRCGEAVLVPERSSDTR